MAQQKTASQLDTSVRAAFSEINISEEDMKKALEMIKNDKPWMVIKIDYKQYVMPYDEGLKVIKAFENAIQISNFYRFSEADIIDDDLVIETKSVSEREVLIKRTLHLLKGNKNNEE